ncbi:MAG TPA: hypothetical protein P5234_05445 [Thermoanaerobaculaceae bacterium]|nr:hypothetical protein [Thermoanaerobaculaceae bacterium]HRS15679.1 hypothetical protein [Thermoanaerobaculaceae bacterium]
MRTRWLAVALIASLALNVLAASAWWRLRAVTAATLATPAPCAEERAIREELARLLCAPEPDRTAVRAALQRLGALRHHRLEAAVERWIATCCRAAPSERARHLEDLNKQLCPWRNPGDGCCAPSPGPRTPPVDSAQPQSTEKERA